MCLTKNQLCSVLLRHLSEVVGTIDKKILNLVNDENFITA